MLDIRPSRGVVMSVLTAALVTLTSWPSGAEATVAWSVDLFANNPRWIEVSVDTRDLSASTYIGDITFEVSLFDAQSKLIARESFAFTKEPPWSLEAGVVHRRYFKLHAVSIKKVVGDRLRYILQVPGLSYLVGPLPEKAQMSANPISAPDSQLRIENAPKSW